MKRRPDRAGFTLIEIMVAIAILGMGLLVLLDAHYGALKLFSDTRDEVLMQGFLERVLGQAEISVLAGTLSGSGDFGARFPGYSYGFTASPMGGGADAKQPQTPLYQVDATVTGPTDSRSMSMLVYNIGG